MDHEPTFAITLEQAGSLWFWSIRRTEWSGPRTGLSKMIADGLHGHTSVGDAAKEAEGEIKIVIAKAKAKAKA